MNFGQQRQRQILKGFGVNEDLEKALPIGTKRTYDGSDYIKTATGWQIQYKKKSGEKERILREQTGLKPEKKEVESALLEWIGVKNIKQVEDEVFKEYLRDSRIYQRSETDFKSGFIRKGIKVFQVLGVNVSKTKMKQFLKEFLEDVFKLKP